jgi:hypothetical protein
MRKLALTAALGAACLGLAACSGGGEGNAAGNNEAGAIEGEGNGVAMAGEGNGGAGAGGGAGGNSAAASNWPRGARIVDENGVTYRVDADGTRVRLTDRDARIVVENGVRYRVDPGGARVRINDRGIDIDGPNIDLPDVDVGVNNKGNVDVDVGDRDPDGGR